MSEVVAGRTAQFEFFDDGVAGLGEVGDVVVFEEVGAAAVDTGTVPFFTARFCRVVG